MRIIDVVITPSIIYYYVAYSNLSREDKLVQYTNTSLSCLKRIDIDKTVFHTVSSKVAKIIYEWIKPLSMF